uniref:Uncharacterized protein n=1 Tax=viral metagenome TaxID=1070528 RepID=A0A6C0EIH1_9ZZZZ
MVQFNERIKYSIIMYLIISIYVWIRKPSLLFYNGKVKSFGIGRNKTIFYYPLLMIVSAIVIYSILLNFY